MVASLLREDRRLRLLSLAAALVVTAAGASALEVETREFALPKESGAIALAVDPRDDGPVWVVLQQAGALVRLDPRTGVIEQIGLGEGSAPSGVALDRNGAPWVADGGRNAMLRIDPTSRDVRSWPLPENAGYAELNAVTFDARGRLWFSGQTGIYGRLDPATGEIRLWDAPAPASIVSAPSGRIAFLSTTDSFVGSVDPDNGTVERVVPPAPWQGPRRLAIDAGGNLYVTEWNVGRLNRWDAATRSWTSWLLPAVRARPFAVHAAEDGGVWIGEATANALLRFDPADRSFQAVGFSRPFADARQIASRGREIWTAEYGADRVAVRRIK